MDSICDSSGLFVCGGMEADTTAVVALGVTDITENNHHLVNGDVNIDHDVTSLKSAMNNNNDDVDDVDAEGEPDDDVDDGDEDTMGEPEPKIGVDDDDDGGGDDYDVDEPVIERRAYSNPELRDLEHHLPQASHAHGLGLGQDGDGPRELTEDEYQEFLEDSECLVENGDTEPQAKDDDDDEPPEGGDDLKGNDGEGEPQGGDDDEPHGDVAEPIEVETETGLKRLAPNMGDISPLDEYPPLGGFHGFGGNPLLMEGDPDGGFSVGSDVDEPREGSPEPDLCYPPHAPAHQFPPLDTPSSDDEDLMPADTADSLENGLNDSVEREAVAQLRNKPANNKVIILSFSVVCFI